MTYCVGMRLNAGLIFMSDTRTNAGVDNISTVKKMHTWEVPGERMIVIMTAGNLATTQSVISLLDERAKAPEDRIQVHATRAKPDTRSCSTPKGVCAYKSRIMRMRATR